MTRHKSEVLKPTRERPKVLKRSIEVHLLDKVADRLGALYQMVGRGLASEQKSILDELLSLTEEVERISGRKSP